MHSDGPAAMVASPVTCRNAPTVGLLFVIGKNTNAAAARTANLLLWVTQKFRRRGIFPWMPPALA